MKRFIVFFISVLLIAVMVSSIFCSKYDPTNTSPESVWVVNGQKVTEDDFMAAITQEALKYETNPGGSAVWDPVTKSIVTEGGGTTAPANHSQAKSKTLSKEKLTVWFTDAVGHVIGSTQVTKGTTIAQSQFVKDIPDIGGATFEAWAYDGQPVDHEIIIRAIYKNADGEFIDPTAKDWPQFK